MKLSPLLTDQYQLVMAYSYWKLGIAEQEAVFHLSFRSLPTYSQYIVAAGLQLVIDLLTNYKFTGEDLDYLQSLHTNETSLFSKDFIEYLRQFTFCCDIDAIPEGTLIFAKEPILRIKGPLIQCQILETTLLNLINFSCLIATKSAKVRQAATNDTVIEFGLRRAQGPDGGVTASRSAFIGGCDATSNVLAGKLFNIPIEGTQAHSWIMAFPTELEAFEAFAQIMGNKTVLLIDTYSTYMGIQHAIQVGQHLKQKGQCLAGIRLDSGNLLELSKLARQLLDDASLYETKIIASGDLDEHIIADLKQKGAPINSWGVGTRLVTSFDQPALNGIYKLTAIQNKMGTWDYKMKISDDPHKSTLPGVQQVRRYHNKDIIYDIMLNETLPEGGQDLLVPIFRTGKLVYRTPSLQEIRQHCIHSVIHFNQEVKQSYPVEIGSKLQAVTV